jgi:radical SAM superfamily enzyme YgiQ (UPF0313 family)
MRVLLINPYYPISETPSPPLGLAYLAAALETTGIEVKILDFVVYPYRRDGLESFLKRFKPHIVGATAVTMTFDHAQGIIKDVKTINPDILTVMGGPHVTFCASQTLHAIPELDIIVLGEGEETLVDLTSAVKDNRHLNTVDGIAYRIGSGVNVTAKRNFIQELDSLPLPARHLLPLGRYRALKLPISMTTSRGCPYQCIFCVGRKMVGAKVRNNSPDRVAAELQNLANFDFHQINIADDLFTADKQHCNAVCDEMIKRNLKIKWTSFARVDTISEELLAKMKTAGCTAVSFGIESANPDILKTIKKGIRLQQVVDAVRMCRQVGIRPYASFILGLPGETQDTIKETAAFAEKLQQEGLAYGFHTLAPFPGTEVREKGDKLGIRILTSDWSKYDANRAVVETAFVSRRMLDEVVIAWENKYDQYLQGIKRQMQDGTATPDEVHQLENLERTVVLYDLMMQNSIEENGTWPDNGTQMSKEKNLKRLVDRIIRTRDIDPKKLKTSLRHAVINKNLDLIYRDGKISWKWRDSLPAKSAS